MSLTLQKVRSPKTIEEQLSEAALACRAALRAPAMVELSQRLPQAPRDAEAWFRLLSRYSLSRENAAILRMRDAVALDRAQGIPSVEHFGVLQALTFSLPRVKDLPLAASVKRKFAELATQVARPAETWRRNFATARMPHVRHLIELATLRQFPAGELIFDFHDCLKFGSMLQIPPRAIPGFLLEVVFGLKASGPLIWPHVNLWRPNPLFLRKVEVERSLWRMAKTLEFRPDVKFLMTESWFFSADVGKFAPHLSWLRDMYEENGAYIVGACPAREEVGFKEGSPKRAELHSAGVFNPRHTLVFWRREDMMEWASKRPDLADEDECLVSVARSRPNAFRVPSPKPPRAAKHNSPFHLWDGVGLLMYRPRVYVLLVLLLPALIVATALATVSWWAAGPAFLAAFVAAWLFQYYIFQ